MVRLLFVVIFATLLIGCKSKADNRQDNIAEKSAIVVPTTLEEDYQVIQTRDLGVVHEGEMISGDIYLKNSSDTLITLDAIKGTCGCLQLTTDFNTIRQGVITKISYTIDSRDKEGEEYFDIIFDTNIGLFVIEQRAVVK